MSVIARHEAISRNAWLYYIYSMHKGGAVYILSSPNRNTLYIGVTANLPNRITEHQQKLKPTGFAARYNCVVLVYYHLFEYIEDAIREEKRLKGCSREYKEQLIASENPDWRDLSVELY